MLPRTAGLWERKKDLQAKRGPRPPLRTVTEMAEEFGVSLQVLMAHLSQKKNDCPSAKCSFARTRLVSGKTYYDPTELRAWWKRQQASQPCTTKGP
jgi:hypothetical protein